MFQVKETSVSLALMILEQRACCQVPTVLCVLQGLQLSSMKGDLLSVDYESSEEEEIEEEEERVVISETGKAK